MRHIDLLNEAMVMIGVPGSGKSTVAKIFCRRWNVQVFSADAIRQELYPHESYNPSRNPMVWGELHYRMGLAIDRQQPVVVDATNAIFTDRLKLVRYLCSKGYKVTGVWVQTPLAVCFERNTARTDKPPVPVVYIKAAHQALEDLKPAYTEGYAKLLTVSKEGIIQRIPRP